MQFNWHSSSAFFLSALMLIYDSRLSPHRKLAELSKVCAQSSDQHRCHMIFERKINEWCAPAGTKVSCWLSCVDSLNPAAYAYNKTWVVPSLPNLRLKLLLPPSPLVLSLLLCPLLTPFHHIFLYSFHSSLFFFLPFISRFHFLSPHIQSSSSTRCAPKLPPPTHPCLDPLPSPLPLVCLGLTGEGDCQGESEVLDWLDEVEEGGSDWLNGFFTFLYGLINPLELLEEEEQSPSGGVMGVPEEDEEDEDEDEGGVRRRGAKDDGNQGQKIVIVGLHNQ